MKKSGYITRKKFKFGPDGDLYQEESKFTQDFKTVSTDGLRGIYYEETKRSDVFLSAHECVEDILCTCNHETIHHCLTQINDEVVDIDVDQEHNMIKKVQWITEIIV